jgi:hypothetical protein
MSKPWLFNNCRWQATIRRQLVLQPTYQVARGLAFGLLEAVEHLNIVRVLGFMHRHVWKAFFMEQRKSTTKSDEVKNISYRKYGINPKSVGTPGSNQG